MTAVATRTTLRDAAAHLFAENARVHTCNPDDFPAHVGGVDARDQTPILGPCGPSCTVKNPAV